MVSVSFVFEGALRFFLSVHRYELIRFADLQAIARAHRIGQKNVVNVYRFIAKDTIEEEIIERAKRKMILELCVIKQVDTQQQSKFESDLKKASKLTNDDLASILKFGAKNLFQKDEKEGADGAPSDKLLEDFDLDDILSRAEQHEVDDDGEGAVDGNKEFLKQWEVKHFDIGNTSWDDVIPVSERIAGQEDPDEALEPLQRRRAAVMYHNDGRGGAGSDAEDGGGKKKKRGKNEKGKKGKAKKSDGPSDELDEREARALYKLLKEFGQFGDRYEDIVRDTELEDKDQDAVLDVAAEMERICVEALQEGEGKKQKNMVRAMLGGLEMNAGIVVQRIKDLKVLAAEMVSLKKDILFRMPDVHVKPVQKWSCDWSIMEDSMLLVGVWRHGHGRWDKIELDDQLNFAGKFFLGGEKDENADKRLPKSLHLQRRADYLLKVLGDWREERERERIAHAKRAKKGKKQAVAKNEPEGKTPVKVVLKREKGKKEAVKDRGTPPKATPAKGAPAIAAPPAKSASAKSKSKSGSGATPKVEANNRVKPASKEEPEPVDDSESDLDPVVEMRCKERLRSVKRALKNLRAAEEYEPEQQLSTIKSCLMVIGIKIDDLLLEVPGYEEEQLWRFVAENFWPGGRPKWTECRNVYKKMLGTPTKEEGRDGASAKASEANGRSNGHGGSSSSSPNGTVGPKGRGDGDAGAGADEKIGKARMERAVSPVGKAGRDGHRHNEGERDRDKRKRDRSASSDDEDKVRKKAKAKANSRRVSPVDRERGRDRGRSRTRSRSRSHSRSRSRSRSRSPPRPVTNGRGRADRYDGRRRSRSRSRDYERYRRRSRSRSPAVARARSRNRETERDRSRDRDRKDEYRGDRGDRGGRRRSRSWSRDRRRYSPSGRGDHWGPERDRRH